MTLARVRPALLVVALAAAGSFAATARSQDLPQQPPQPRLPIFRAESRLVRVDAYPSRDGKIIPDLTAADFQVLEDGKPQTVETVEYIDFTSMVTTEGERRDPNSQRDGFNLAADPRYRIFVIYLDTYHVDFSGSHAVRRPLVDMLNRMLGRRDLFGVLTPQQIPMRDLLLGQQTLSIEEQLAKHWTWGSADSMRQSDQELMLEACFPRQRDGGLSIDLQYRQRLDKVFSDLEETTTILGGLRDERKNILLFSRGWVLPPSAPMLAPRAAPGPPPIGITNAGKLTLGPGRGGEVDSRWCKDELDRLSTIDFAARQRDLISRAREANVTFYTVNPTGLEAGGSAAENQRINYRTDRLHELASETDGIPVLNTNDLRAGLSRVTDHLAAHYVLSYYSTNTTWDGRVRRITVRLASSDTPIRARREYRAPTAEEMALMRNPPAPAIPATPPAFEEALATLKRLRPSAALNVYGRAAHGEITVVGEISAARMEAGRWKNGGEMQVMVSDASGEVTAASKAEFAAGARGAIVTAPARGTGPWEAVVRVLGEGETPEEDRFTIPATSAGLIGSPLTYRAAPARSSPRRPVAGFDFRRTERVIVEWPLLAPVETHAARLLGRDGKALDLTVALSQSGSGTSRAIVAELNLAPLTAGEYVIELTAASDGRVETGHVALRVRR